MASPESRFREIVISSLKVGAATVASMLGWVVGGKILAVELGAAGVGVFGLLRQLLQNLNVLSSLNGANALVQGLASRSGNSQDRFVSTVGRIYAVGAASIALVLLAGAPWLGPWLVPHPQAPSLLRWLALAVVVVTAQGYFVGLLNGHRAVDALVRSQALGPVAILVTVLPVAKLIRTGHPVGLVLMLIIPGTAVSIAAMVRALRLGWFRPLRYGFDRGAAGMFFRTSAVLLITGALTTGTQYFQSWLVAERLGLEQAGLFWVAWTLSMTYVTVVLGSYSTYYMPALTALIDRPARLALIRDYLRLALLAMPILVSLVVLLKPWIVLVMFSAKLLPALQVMRWMLVGDFFKGIAWVLAFPMLAFNEMRWFFWTEAAFNLTLAGFVVAVLVLAGNIEYLGAAFLALYLAYLGAMYWYLRRSHGFRVRPGEVRRFVGGLALVLWTSALTWSATRVTFSTASAWALGVSVFSLVSLKGLAPLSHMRPGLGPPSTAIPAAWTPEGDTPRNDETA